MDIARVVGQLFSTPEERVDGLLKTTGQARYAADLRLEGMLWCTYVRSPLAHASIARIDVTAARAAPGVQAVLTGADLPPNTRFGRSVLDWPVLATDRVRFVGDRVAAVAADTRAAAERAAALVAVEYAALDGVFSPVEALSSSAPILHPDRERYQHLSPQTRPQPSGNVQGREVVEVGTEDERSAAFTGAYRVFAHSFTSPRQHQGYLEPHACVVWIDPGGVVRVRSSNKTPFALRQQLARTLGLNESHISVDCSFIGGDFGGKGTSLDEFTCYYLARATGRPVKAVMSYVDELQASSPRHPVSLHLRTAVDEQGMFLAHEAKLLFDGGAYAGAKPSKNAILHGSFATMSPYRVPLSRIEVTSVYTNNVPGGNMRAPGSFQAIFAGESHVDMIARGMGIDSLSLRRQNAVRSGDRNTLGERIRAPRIGEVVDAVADDARWRSPCPPNHGRGIAIALKDIDGGAAWISLRVSPETGQVDVLTGLADQGTGAHTMVQRVIAAELSIAPERVVVRYGATEDALPDAGSGGARVTRVTGGAALDAARKLKANLLDLAAETYGWPSDQVRLQDDYFLTGDERVPFSAVAEQIGRAGDVAVTGSFDSADGGQRLAETNTVATAVEVAVDPETGAVTVVDALAAVAVGTIINPVAHQGQLTGGFAFGIGAALMEEMGSEEGRVSTLNLGDYKLPTQTDLPPLRTILLQSEAGPGPFGAQAAGEVTNITVVPAIANAVDAAVGTRLTTFPFTAERVLESLRTRPVDATRQETSP